MDEFQAGWALVAAAREASDDAIIRIAPELCVTDWGAQGRMVKVCDAYNNVRMLMNEYVTECENAYERDFPNMLGV